MNNTGEKKQENIVFVVYDGIANSVFESQVVQPMLKKIADGSYGHVTLVSFEQKKPAMQMLVKKIPAHDQFHLVIGRKLPFWGVSSLFFASYQLTKLLDFTAVDRIIARGPLAGLVAYQALQKQKKLLNRGVCLSIQARGLCAEEFRYTWEQGSNHSLYGSLAYALKLRTFYKLEKYVFGQCSRLAAHVTIESVSPALKNYLVEEFGAKKEHIGLAEQDIPSHVDQQQIAAWRQEIRQELDIAAHRKVYVYSGSYKPWQCAPETIEYFVDQYKINSNSFLLILSQDAEQFYKHLEQSGVVSCNYVIRSVRPADLLKYLAAADYGLLFRKQDVVNWVSRPTKMLEYQAVGLKIIHNNTIAWLKEVCPN